MKLVKVVQERRALMMRLEHDQEMIPEVHSLVEIEGRMWRVTGAQWAGYPVAPPRIKPDFTLFVESIPEPMARQGAG